MAANTEVKKWVISEPYLNLHCALGEGPFYEKATNSLRFVDIINRRLHSVCLDKGPESAETLQLDTRISVTADIKGVDPSEKILFGAKYGMAVLNRKTGTYDYITRPEDDNKETLRGNDGAVDPHGRFWLGTMTDFGYGENQPHGSLYIFDGKKPAQTVKSSITIPNSVGWSPDKKTMYFVDSFNRTVFAYDYNLSAAADGSSPVSNERVFYRHPEGLTGEPDGFRIDVEGNIWQAVWGESRVLKLSPHNGEVLAEIRLPTPRVTCPQFVGTELFITTAAIEPGPGVSAEEVEKSGALYRVDVGVEGLEPFAFEMPA